MNANLRKIENCCATTILQHQENPDPASKSRLRHYAVAAGKLPSIFNPINTPTPDKQGDYLFGVTVGYPFGSSTIRQKRLADIVSISTHAMFRKAQAEKMYF
jgi:hypothetical protein